MPDIRDYVAAQIRPYKKILIGVVIAAVFIGLAVYMYRTYGAKVLKEKKFVNVANESPNKIEINVKIFTVDWCPHCQKAAPEWTVFSDKYNGKIINGYQIKCEKFDCTDASDDAIADAVKNYGIDSYPTVFLIRDGERYDFDAKVKADSLGKFVETVAAQ